jgi:hypothetical protein
VDLTSHFGPLAGPFWLGPRTSVGQAGLVAGLVSFKETGPLLLLFLLFFYFISLKFKFEFEFSFNSCELM